MHQRLRQRRVRVHGQFEVLRHRPQLDRQRRLADQLARAGAGDAGAEHAVGVRLDHQLGHAVVAPERRRAARGGPRHRGHEHLDAAVGGLGLGQAGPRDLGVGVDHGGDGGRVPRGGAAGDGLDGDARLVRGLVREHRLARHVADGEDVRLGGAALRVDLDEAARVQPHGGAFEAQPRAVGAAAGGDQHALELAVLGRAVRARDARADGLAGVLDRQHRGFEADRLEVALEAALEVAHEVAIDAGHEACGHLHDGDARAERGVDAAQLQPDVAAADDEQRLRHALQLQRRGRVEHPRAVEGERRGARGGGAGGDDGVVEADRARGAAVRGRDAQRVGIDERRAALLVAHPVAAGELAEAARQALDDAAAEAAQPFEVDLRLAEGDAPLLGLPRLADQGGDVEQGLRGDAAAVEADAAGVRLLVDQRDLHPEAGGEEGGGVAAGPPADDGEAYAFVGHARSSPAAPRRATAPAAAAPRRLRRSS